MEKYLAMGHLSQVGRQMEACIDYLEIYVQYCLVVYAKVIT